MRTALDIFEFIPAIFDLEVFFAFAFHLALQTDRQTDRHTHTHTQNTLKHPKMLNVA